MIDLPAHERALYFSTRKKISPAFDSFGSMSEWKALYQNELRSQAKLSLIAPRAKAD
jgi:hypothetical protein